MFQTKYRIEFFSIKDESYRIDLQIDNYVGDIIFLTGGSQPLILESSQDNFIYVPTRLQGGSINIISDVYLTDLYTNKHQDIRVIIYKDNNVFFSGFIEPEIYTQPNEGGLFELELNIISSIATLEYIPYVAVDKSETFHSLLSNAIVKSKGVFHSIYFTKIWNKKIEELYVSSSNWFDEKNEPSTCLDIIKEICKFMCLTLTEKNGSLYFIDVDYIKTNNIDYYQYDGSFNSPTSVTLSNSIQLIGDIDSTGVNDNLSKISSYNKISVLCSDYELDNDLLFPTLDNAERGIFIGHGDSTSYDDNYYQKYFYNDVTYETYQYTENLSSGFNRTSLDLLEPQDQCGCMIISQNNFKYKDRPNSLTWEDMIQIKLFENLGGESGNYDTTRLLNTADDWTYPIIKYTMDKTISFDKNQFISIDGQIFYLDKNDGFVITDRTNRDDKIENNADGKLYYYIPCSVRIGDYYYSGGDMSTATWTTTPTVFRIDLDLQKGDHFTNHWINFENYNDFLYGVPDLNGFMIKINRDLIGDFEIIFYTPKQRTYYRLSPSTGHLQSYFNRYCFLKNIKVSIQKQKQTNKKYQKQDTIYTNVINNEFLNEAEDIELMLTSKNESELSMSKVFTSDGVIIDTVTSTYLGVEKPEKLIINKIVSQYQEPKIKINEQTRTDLMPYQLVELNSQPNKTFLIVGENIDARNASSTVTLTEII